MVDQLCCDGSPHPPSVSEAAGHNAPLLITVPSVDPPRRVDLYLSEALPRFTRSKIQELIKTGDVRLNDLPTKASIKVKPGDTLTVYPRERMPSRAVPEEIPLDILYDDDSLIIINKPAGMVVHEGAGRTGGTLVNALLYHFGTLSHRGNLQRPGIVHRLDKDTSGVMVAAKNDMSHHHLAQQFKAHSIKRRYRALVWGTLKENEGTVDLPIGRHSSDRKKMSVRTSGGRRAVTHYKVIKQYDSFSLLELALETGRTHQIRVHLSHLHHPVVGDQTYGRKSIPPHLPKPLLDGLKRFKRQALHAALLGFTHPLTKRYMEFTAPLPADMEQLIALVEQVPALQ